MKKVLAICGETSGDLHLSNLIKNLLKQNPDLQIDAVCGEHTEKNKINKLFDIKEMNFMGFFEIFKNLRKIISIENKIKNFIRNNNYSLVILVDYPGLNLRLAQFCFNNDLPVIYYICPQIWAWHYSRIYKLIKFCKKLLVIFRFEEEIYKKENFNEVYFIGHPLLDVFNNYQCKELKKDYIAILPGSRMQEIKKILPIQIEVSKLLYHKFDKNFKFLVSFQNTEIENSFKDMLPNFIEYYTGNIYEILSRSYFALVTSGTATLETALFEIPMFVFYKVNFLSALLAKYLINIKNISLVNIVLNKTVVPEYLQNNLIPEKIAEDAFKLLKNENEYYRIKSELKKIKSLLQNGENKSPNEYAAKIINDYLVSL
ncbi:MAG TPA: lipid-A-disaccharide synthase [bacterium]|nr:lipid-A-disaccharide synthase [bacterium]HOL46826.1 lipid-A-disaccharide synthase [bacterium]HPQ18648.1 lipid-A-disaccharide synthase [bacterium]